MTVYFIRAEGMDAVKIGVARDPWRRLVNLQIGSPQELSIFRLLAGDRAVERELHRRFHNLRLNGEWFRFGSEMLAPLGYEDIEITAPPTKRQSLSHKVEAGADPVFIKALMVAGGVKTLAAAVGVSSSAVSQWRQVPIYRVLAVESLTGISRHELRPDIYPVSQ